MKVYIYAPKTPYSFGIALVAATSQEEADTIARKQSSILKFSKILDGVTAEGESRVLIDESGEM